MARDAVSDIRDRIDIVDLVQEYVPSLKRAGANYKGLCPFHQEKTPSFIVFPQSQNFHCFGCGKGGDLFTFYMGVENVEFREALRELARRAGVELDVSAPKRPEQQEKAARLIEVNELAALWFHHILTSTTMGAAGRQIIADRHVSDEMVERFKLGFAPDSWESLLNFLASRNVPTELAAEAGLASARESGGFYDRFRNRLIFPIRNRDGQTVGFGGRALGDAQPKYLNTAQTEIFDKSHLVYALDLAKDAIREQKEVVIVEGYMDVITAHQFGYHNVVASMGTALTEAQVGQIKRGADRVILALDADAAGQLATIRGLETMSSALDADLAPTVSASGLLQFERKLKTDIRIVQLQGGKDPDEIIKQDPDAWPRIVRSALPFLDFTIETLTRDLDLSDPNEKSTVVRQVLPLLRQIPDKIKENHYTRMLARRLDVSEEVIVAEKRRLTVGGRSQAIRQANASKDFTRPRLRSNEDMLVALLLRHHTLNYALLELINDDELQDGRNREIVRVLRDPATNQLEGQDLAIALEDDVADHADRLLAMLEGRPEQFPSHVITETTQIIGKLRRERFAFLQRQLDQDLKEAERSGDKEARREVLQRMASLANSTSVNDPAPSPYFRDLRSKPTY